MLGEIHFEKSSSPLYILNLKICIRYMCMGSSRKPHNRRTQQTQTDATIVYIRLLFLTAFDQ